MLYGVTIEKGQYQKVYRVIVTHLVQETLDSLQYFWALQLHRVLNLGHL